MYAVFMLWWKCSRRPKSFAFQRLPYKSNYAFTNNNNMSINRTGPQTTVTLVNQNISAKQSRADSDFPINRKKPSNLNETLKAQMSASRSCKHILDLILRHNNNETGIGVYHKAIQRCGELCDVEACEQIFKLLYNNRTVQPSLFTFSSLFYAFSRNDVPWKSKEYFRKMESLNIAPDVSAATSLLFAYKRRIDKPEVDSIWQQTVVKYKLKPNLQLCTLMMLIEANHEHTPDPQKWLQILTENGCTPDIATIGTVIKVYAQSLQIQAMEEIKMNAHTLYNVQLSPIAYVSLMGGYLKVSNAKQALAMYDECVELFGADHAHTLAQQLWSSRRAALVQLLQQETEQTAKDVLYADIMNMPMTGNTKHLKYNRFDHGTQKLEASIYYFNFEHQNPTLIRTFLRLRDAYDLGYWNKHSKTNQWMIDLHSFDYTCAAFLLEYIFKHEAPFVLKMDKIIILCGKRTHVSLPAVSGNIGISAFCQQCLQSFNPPISSHVPKYNQALLCLEKAEVAKYCAATNGENKNKDAFANADVE